MTDYLSAHLPFDMLLQVLSSLSVRDRMAARAACRRLAHAERSLQRTGKIHNISVYRTAADEFTLFAEEGTETEWRRREGRKRQTSIGKMNGWTTEGAIEKSGGVIACHSVEGRPVPEQWKRSTVKRRDRELSSITFNTDSEACLGRVGEALSQLLRVAEVDVVRIQQITLTSAVAEELREALSCAVIRDISITATSNTDDSLDWLTEIPSTRLSLALRSSFSSSSQTIESFLISATSRLAQVSLYLENENSPKRSFLSDALFLSLLSSTCSCLQLFFACDALTADGVITVIKHLRSLPHSVGFLIHLDKAIVDDVLASLAKTPDARDQSEQISVRTGTLGGDQRCQEFRYLHLSTEDERRFTSINGPDCFFPQF